MGSCTSHDTSRSQNLSLKLQQRFGIVRAYGCMEVRFLSCSCDYRLFEIMSWAADLDLEKG